MSGETAERYTVLAIPLPQQSFGVSDIDCTEASDKDDAQAHKTVLLEDCIDCCSSSTDYSSSYRYGSMNTLLIPVDMYR